MCSAAQGRRAAKWGQAADSLPKWSRMRRPVALGGDGNPFTPNQRLAVTPQRGAPSSRHEPPRAAWRRALSQAAATAASAAPPSPRPLHRRRFSARMVPALASSSSPCARPSQRARPKNRWPPRPRGCPPSASHAESHLCMQHTSFSLWVAEYSLDTSVRAACRARHAAACRAPAAAPRGRRERMSGQSIEWGVAQDRSPAGLRSIGDQRTGSFLD